MATVLLADARRSGVSDSGAPEGRSLLKTLIASLVLLGLLGAAPVARAEIGTPDVVPAATLLLPYFEVDLSNPAGLTTLLSINNASDEMVLAQVNVWSEWFVPIIGFTVYLTGYDVQTINLRDVIVNGDLPNTGPTNTLSSLGDFSVGPHNTFGGTCSSAPGLVPNYAPLTPLFLQVVQQSLSGQPLATSGQCASLPGNTTRARGFVTVDVVRRCPDTFPTAINYFIDGGNGDATNENVLWGDYFLVDPANDFAEGFTLVHLEADGASLGVLDGSCDTVDRNPTTFYCTIRNPVAAPGEDNREGLPSVYATRYIQGGAFTGGTSLLAWRDKNGTGPGTYRSCATTPIPLGQSQLVVFDEQENGVVSTDAPFPFNARRVAVGTDLTVDTPFGWLFLNLNDGNLAQEFFRQGHITTTMSASGRFAVGFDAINLNNLTLGADNRRGPRNPDPTLAPPVNLNVPTLFVGP
jgi:hypothetical protein